MPFQIRRVVVKNDSDVRAVITGDEVVSTTAVGENLLAGLSLFRTHATASLATRIIESLRS